MTGFLLAVALLQFPSAPPNPDSVETIRRNARRAEANFERLARQLAPLKFSSMDGTNCDEIVGRFCLRYDIGEMPEPPEEPGRVVDARRSAIEALRHAFSYQPGEFSTSGPLIRYLVEDDRAAEAASAARTFAALSGDSIWGPLMLGFALHAALDDTAAQRLFDQALRRMPAEDRDRILDVEWILSPDDRGRYRKLEAPAREVFENTLWAFADPLYLTPGNERRNQHIARHVWSRALERAPVVGGMVRWGRDLEQLTVRYGIPAGRTRTPGSIGRDASLVEHFDPDQLAYIPERLLTRGPPPTPPPGETWSLEDPRSRSGYAPGTIRRLRPLHHQVTLIPVGDSTVLRVDGMAVLDTVATGADSASVGLWVIGDAATPVRAWTGPITLVSDTVRVSFEQTVPPGEYLYSAEIFEPGTRFGARARYAMDIPVNPGSILVSDPLITHAFRGGILPNHRGDASLRPHSNLVFAPGDTIGLYAEARGLGPSVSDRAPFRVELSMRRADRASLPSRVISWLGRRVGLSQPEVPARLGWEADLVGGGPAIIAVDFPILVDGSGLYLIELEITDLVTRRTGSSRRLVRVEKGP